jgi:protein-S-isoprenylcysteine O-methyltransferase Ste14
VADWARGILMRLQPVNQRTRIHVLQAGGLAFATIVLFAQPMLAGREHEFIEMTGFFLALLCLGGRMWSILYVGSRKTKELVTSGPYSITRNPLYFFSIIGAVGLGLIYGSITVAFALGALAYAVFTITAAKEAAHLRAVFGPRYEAYARQTPLLWLRLSQYRDSPDVVFSPRALTRTFLDGLFFLAAFPAIEAVEHLQAGGILPVLLRIL